jgi:hypothetical protein
LRPTTFNHRCVIDQGIARSVVFCAIIIKRLIKLEAFEHWLYHSKKSSIPEMDSPSGLLTRDLEIDIYSYTREATFRCWSALSFVLLVLPGLRRLAVTQLPVNRGVAVLLSRVSHLTKLTLWIDSTDALSMNLFINLAKINSLEELYLAMGAPPDSRDRSVLDFQLEAPLHLPKLQRFYFYIEDFPHHVSAFAYIFRCRIKEGCLFYLDAPSAKRVDALNLIPFFDNHKPRDVRLICASEVLEALSEQIALAHHVTVACGPVPLSIVKHGHLPRNFVFSVDPAQASETTSLWEFLDAVGEQPDHSSTPYMLSIITELDIDEGEMVGHRFRWFDGEQDEHAAFISRLAAEAVRLRRKGVLIVDGDGHDITNIADT